MLTVLQEWGQVISMGLRAAPTIIRGTNGIISKGIGIASEKFLPKQVGSFVSRNSLKIADNLNPISPGKVGFAFDAYQKSQGNEPTSLASVTYRPVLNTLYKDDVVTDAWETGQNYLSSHGISNDAVEPY